MPAPMMIVHLPPVSSAVRPLAGEADEDVAGDSGVLLGPAADGSEKRRVILCYARSEDVTMPRPTFGDPKTDFIFKRIFGSEPHKHLLIKLLNVLLELEEGQLIQDLSYLSAEEKIPREEMKLSIVDVRPHPFD